MTLQALVGPGRYFGFLICLRAVGLLGRVIISSQGLYLNTRQHKHRKTHIHTIKHPCPRRDSIPQSRPPSDRRLFMPQTARLPRPASGCIDPYFLDFGISWRWMVSFTPWSHNPWKDPPPTTHCIGGWVGPRAAWTIWRRENSWFYRDSNSDQSVV
jgi:hypothetical protein